MNRSEARIIAEELYKLMKDDIKKHVSEFVKEEKEEWLNIVQVSEFMGVSVGYIKDHIHEIPHTKVGRLNRFRKSDIVRLMER